MHKATKKDRLSLMPPLYLIVVFLLLVAFIVFMGSLYYEQQKEIIKKEKTDELTAIANLKANQLSSWYKDRLAEAQWAYSNPMVHFRIVKVLKGLSTPLIRHETLSWLDSRVRYQKYSSASVFRADGTLLMNIPAKEESLDPVIKDLLSNGPAPLGITFIDFHQRAPGRKVELGMFIPIHDDAPEDYTILGYIYLKIDPEEFLYPLIQSWPTPSITAESLLVRKEKNDVLFLNDLRHRKNTALKLRFPVDTKNLPAAMAVRGHLDVVEGFDYRNKAVLAVSMKVQNLPWYVISKIDQEEAYASVRTTAITVTLFVVLIIIATGAILIVWWRGRQAKMYRRQLELEKERLVLAERVNLLTRYANDIILLADEDWHILEANDRAVQTYQYSLEELQGKNIHELHPIEYKPAFEHQAQDIKSRESALYETAHQRKDGSVIQVEVSERLVELGGRKCILEIIRDITERKRDESEREKLIQELQYALAEIKTLSGFIPICANCKKIRDDKGYWNQIENYITKHSNAVFSHSICPECAKRLYPGVKT